MTRKIPSIFTVLNLCCGFSAILVADLHMSTLLLLLGMFFDVIDGLLARWLNVQSDLGRELDSLADLVSFGVAPAFLYTLLMPGNHWVFYIPAFFILVGSALRLAIFNLRPDTKYFTGLPTPASTFFLAGLYIGVHFQSEITVDMISKPVVYMCVPVALMLLNLSKLRMFSFKQFGTNLNYNIFILASLLVFAGLTFVDYKLSMPIGVIIYILLSVVYSIRVNKENTRDKEWRLK